MNSGCGFPEDYSINVIVTHWAYSTSAGECSACGGYNATLPVIVVNIGVTQIKLCSVCAEGLLSNLKYLLAQNLGTGRGNG